MKCVHTFGTNRHKRQADITILFEYILDSEHAQRNVGLDLVPHLLINVTADYASRQIFVNLIIFLKIKNN